MESNQQRLQRLLDEGNWSQSDKDWLMDYLENTDAAELHRLMRQLHEEDSYADEKIAGHVSAIMRQRIADATGIDMSVERKSALRRSFLSRRWARLAAASILLLVGVYAYHLLSDEPRKELLKQGESQLSKGDIEPGGNKAMLTLANGSTIVLNNAANGILTQQGNAKVIKLDSGQLAYNGGSVVRNKRMAVQYNTLTTPRGGQYQIVLADGTKVWLNAASSIRYPTVFSGAERKVQITGECYFEVAKNDAMPFIVEANHMEIDVLGTHFNVMSYHDEAVVRTTLLEGKVKVVSPVQHNAQLLMPGQQAEMDKSGAMQVKEVDISQAVAWKDGLFVFNNDDIQTVMRQLSRWYNIDVIIRGHIPQHFTGSIHRDVAFSKVFEVLQQTGSLHFETENGKIIVSS